MEISEEHLSLVSSIFDQANGRPLCEEELRLINQSGLSDYSAADLEAALVGALNAGRPGSYRASAYWVLGKRYNMELLPAFKKWLAQELREQEFDALYQILIALDNLEEPVFGKDRNGGYALMDSELNARDARTYLEKYA